jgi:hypothetical protein
MQLLLGSGPRNSVDSGHMRAPVENCSAGCINVLAAAAPGRTAMAKSAPCANRMARRFCECGTPLFRACSRQQRRLEAINEDDDGDRLQWHRPD